MWANLAGESASGLPLGPFTIWLNIDPLVSVSISSANVAPFLNTSGVLGAGGSPATQPKFVAPAGFLAPAIGLNIGFEYGTYLGLTFTSVSNSVLVKINS